MQNLNDLKVLQEVKSKTGERYWWTIPICAYNKKTWLHFFKLIYFNITGRSYKVYNIRHEMSYLETAYKRAFIKYEWSAREFARFLTNSVAKSYERSAYTFTLKTFSKKSKYIDSIMFSYDCRFRKIRDNDKFEGTIHLPFFPLTGGQDDLHAVFDMIGDDIVLIAYNYGVPNYVKYLQYRSNLKFEESIELFKKRLKDFILKNRRDKEFTKRILTGFIRSSILWEPYTTRKQREKFGEDSLIINWRRELNKMIEIYKFKDEKWWREKHVTYTYKRLPTVKDFFK